jgi:hypothetical protein
MPTTAAVRTTATATSRRALLAAALLTLALGAAACGTSSGAGPRPAASGPPSAEALAAVRGAVAGALSRTATLSMTLSGGALFGSPGARVAASGAFDFGALSGSLTFTTPGAPANEPVIFTPTAVYVRPPAPGNLLPAGKTWTVADFTNPESLTASFPQLIAQSEAVNPAFTLTELLWGSAAAAAPAHQTVNGQDWSRYAVTLDLNRALSAVTGPAQVPFSRALATEVAALGGSVAGTGRPATLPATVWLAAGGRIARVAVAPPGVGAGTVTTDLRAFGGAVQVQPPATALVVDILEVGPSGERENANGGDADGG